MYFLIVFKKAGKMFVREPRRQLVFQIRNSEKQTPYVTRSSSTDLGERFKVSKWLGGSNLQETRVFCTEQAGEMWVSDNGQFNFVLTHFQTATVQQTYVSRLLSGPPSNGHQNTNTCLVSSRAASISAVLATRTMLGRLILNNFQLQIIVYLIPHAPVSLVLWL